ncbi:hypothetical protein Cni_G16340 [Canna indica]|uniref:Non-haem dioxygenase N-terminal domain-containing protein n=1 Tax=Canna indica TaxID=4628 RepID=A0AAQ3QCH4_9LILI|nr:hypothetical protein Cni_G16340 [Canna indica]
MYAKYAAVNAPSILYAEAFAICKWNHLPSFKPTSSPSHYFSSSSSSSIPKICKRNHLSLRQADILPLPPPLILPHPPLPPPPRRAARRSPPLRLFPRRLLFHLPHPTPSVDPISPASSHCAEENLKVGEQRPTHQTRWEANFTRLPPLASDVNKGKSPSSGDNHVIVFNSRLWKQPKIPSSFVWPPSERPPAMDELHILVVDLQGLFDVDEASIQRAAEAVRTACVTHGFFQVINHRIDATISRDTFVAAEEFSNLPLSDKMKVPKQSGNTWGYAVAHAERFSHKLPWKETLTFCYDDNKNGEDIVDYFTFKMEEVEEEKKKHELN